MTEEERLKEINKIMSSLTPDELIILGIMFHEIYDSETRSTIQEKKGTSNAPC